MIGVLHEVVVVGTGPSACAVVSALLARGVRPVVLDSAGDVRPQSGIAGKSLDLGTGFKTWNGSDAMYQGHPYSRITYETGLTTRAGNYLGGLSRVWGATYGEYSDYRNWPLECVPTRVDWRAVAQLVPRSVVGEMPLPAEEAQLPLPMEPRLRSLLRSAVSGPSLKAVPSSLAIETDVTSPRACRLEGTCLQGCPHDSIWWAGEQFVRWEAEGVIGLRRGWLVESLGESVQHVDLKVMTEQGSREHIRAQQVFLGSGVISTAAILVTSGVASSLTVRDSQTAFGGMVSIRGSAWRPYYGPSLSQVWMRSSQDASFMAQMYPPDASHADRLGRKLPGMRPVAVARVNQRLFPLIAYLDSHQSGTLTVTPYGDSVRVSVGSIGDHKAMRRNVAKLARQVLTSGFVLPPIALEMAPPGGGFHMGGTMPHGSATDGWGRPHGSQRIHLVDASVFPHIEAGSITPTVMANAHRIGRTAPVAGAA